MAVHDSVPPILNLPPVLPGPGEGASSPNRLRWWIHFILIGAYPLVLGALSLGRVELQEPALTRTVKGLLLVCALEVGVFTIVFTLACLASRASLDDLLLRAKNKWLVVPLGIGYSVALRLGLAVGLGIIGAVMVIARIVSPEQIQDFFTANRPDVESLVDVSALRRNPLYFWLTVTLVSFVVAGLREELWRAGVLAGMRRLWPRYFGSTRGQIVAVALAAVVFGLGHLPQGALAVALTGFLGLGLGLIMVLHKSIWPAVVAHGMFDAATFALLPFAMEQLKRFS